MSLDRFQNSYHLFSNPLVLEISGKDCTRYLQSRLSNDIKKLSPSETCLAACLSPQGKTEALFFVYKKAENLYLLFCPDYDQEQVIASLSKFIIADQVNINVLDAYHFLVSSSKLSADNYACSYQLRNLFFYLFEKNSTADLTALKEITVQEFDCFRINNNLPLFPFDIKPGTLFSEFQLEEAVSYDKGCYAGQEVMERVSALGKLPAKVLAYTFTTQDNHDLPLEINNSEGERIGEVITINKIDQQYFCFLKVKQKYLEQKAILSTGLELELIAS